MAARSDLKLPIFLEPSGPSLLDRSGAASFHSPFQNHVDQLVGGFVAQATDWKTLAALTAGSLAYRTGRLGVMGLGSGNVARVASVGLGLTAEVSSFEFAQRALHPENPNLWRWNGAGGLRQGLLHSLITFGALKGAGHLTRGQNIILQHLTQDAAMVAGHQLTGALGIAPRPTGSLAEQFLHAEAMTLQIGAGLSLAHSVAQGLHFLERSLVLSSPSPVSNGNEGDSRFPFGRQAAFAALGPEGAREVSEKDPRPRPILAMQQSGEGGSSPEKRGKLVLLDPAQGLGSDLLVFHPEKRPEPAPVEGLTPEWRKLFEQGGRIIKWGEGRRLVGISSEAPTEVTEAVAKLFETWRALHGFQKVPFEDTRKAWESLRGRLNEQGIVLSYEVRGRILAPESLGEYQDSRWLLHGDLLLAMDALLKRLPPSLLQLQRGGKKSIQEIRWLLDSPDAVGDESRPCNGYRDGMILLPPALLRGSRSRFAEWVLHAFGHALAEAHGEDLAFRRSYDVIRRGHTLWGLAWGEPPEMRGQRQRNSFTEFLVEALLSYVSAGSTFRDYAKYSPTPGAWAEAYDRMRKIFGGWEYDYGQGESIARSEPLPPPAKEPFLVFKGGILARWLLELVPSMGWVGTVEKIDGEWVIASGLKQKRNGLEEEIEGLARVEGAQIRAGKPLEPGDKVHYLPPVAGGSSQGDISPLKPTGGVVTPQGLGGSSPFLSSDAAHSEFFAMAGDWVKKEIAPLPGMRIQQNLYLAERVFDPLEGGAEIPPGERHELMKALLKLPPHFRRVLEFSLSQDAEEFALEYIVHLHQEFQRLGIHLYGRGREGGFKLRVPSLPLLEAFLSFHFKNQALRFIYFRGEMPPDDAVAFLRRGERPVGLALSNIELNGRFVHPFPYALHDLYHIIRFSAAIRPWMRSAAALYYETHREFLEKMDPPAGVQFHSRREMARIADLGLYSDYKLAAIISNYVSEVRKDLSLPAEEKRRALLWVLSAYLRNTYRYSEELLDHEVATHRRVLRNILDDISPSSSGQPFAGSFPLFLR